MATGTPPAVAAERFYRRSFLHGHQSSSFGFLSFLLSSVRLAPSVLRGLLSVRLTPNALRRLLSVRLTPHVLHGLLFLSHFRAFLPVSHLVPASSLPLLSCYLAPLALSLPLLPCSLATPALYFPSPRIFASLLSCSQQTSQEQKQKKIEEFTCLRAPVSPPGCGIP